MTSRAGAGMSRSSKLSSNMTRASRQVASRRCPSAERGGMRACTACSTATCPSLGKGPMVMATTCWARASRAMKRSQSSIGCPADKASSRAAVPANLVVGSGRIKAGGAFTPPADRRFHLPFDATLPLPHAFLSSRRIAVGPRSWADGIGRREAPQPFAMMPPGPARSDIALRHRSD